MTDANLMDADCIHGVTWWECSECDKCTCTITHDEATNMTTIDPTGCTYSGHMEPWAPGEEPDDPPILG